MIATDDDLPIQTLTYRIIRENKGEISTEYNLLLDDSDGRLNFSGIFDFESTSDGDLRLTLEVSDDGLPRLADVVELVISLRDVNDNAPRLLAQILPYEISEALPPRTLVATIPIDDEDSSARHRMVARAQVVNGAPFSVEYNATSSYLNLRTNATLDYDEGTIHHEVCDILTLEF